MTRTAPASTPAIDDTAAVADSLAAALDSLDVAETPAPKKTRRARKSTKNATPKVSEIVASEPFTAATVADDGKTVRVALPTVKLRKTVRTSDAMLAAALTAAADAMTDSETRRETRRALVRNEHGGFDSVAVTADDAGKGAMVTTYARPSTVDITRSLVALGDVDLAAAPDAIGTEYGITADGIRRHLQGRPTKEPVAAAVKEHAARITAAVGQTKNKCRGRRAAAVLLALSLVKPTE